jgi:carboxymethylenebutenolidase
MKDADDKITRSKAGGMSRRDFAALSAGAGLAAVGGLRSAQAAADVVQTDVEIRTAGGSCDAALAHPSGKGAWPAVIIFPDIFGLRPAMRDMAKRLATAGYTVLVPNPFYRATRAPGLGPDFSFDSAADRAQLAALRAPLTNAGVAADATAYVQYLDRLAVVDRAAPVGVVGYCMGGPMTLQAAAGVPGRIGAGASFHGGGLVTDQPDSPHLLVPAVRAQFYFGIAASDDARQPDAKTRLAAAFKAAHREARIEVYEGTAHGWCIRDMPLQAGKPIYDEPAAERAWGELLALYRHTLVRA